VTCAHQTISRAELVAWAQRLAGSFAELGVTPGSLRRGPPPRRRAAQLRAALAFAQCMRAHGLSQFPDPLTTYGSGFTPGRRVHFPAISPTEVQSPALRQAAKARGLQVPTGPPVATAGKQQEARDLPLAPAGCPQGGQLPDALAAAVRASEIAETEAGLVVS
jgi:hypothetical protein